MSRRSEGVQDLLRAAIGELIARKVKDPRVCMATVSRVTVSSDLAHAVVKVSVLGDEEHRQNAVGALQHAKGFIRTQLARRLRLRVIPDLVFELDRGAENSQRMSDILESLHDYDART